MATHDGFEEEHRPTLREKFWLMLGYRYHLKTHDADLMRQLPGWMIVSSYMKFSWGDRFRLLLTGVLRIDIRQATDVHVKQCISKLSYRIEPPYDGPR